MQMEYANEQAANRKRRSKPTVSDTGNEEEGIRERTRPPSGSAEPLRPSQIRAATHPLQIQLPPPPSRPVFSENTATSPLPY